MKKLNEEQAKALVRLPECVIDWFKESLEEQLFNNITAEAPHDKWGQGKAQILLELCTSIKNAKITAEKLAR